MENDLGRIPVFIGFLTVPRACRPLAPANGQETRSAPRHLIGCDGGGEGGGGKRLCTQYSKGQNRAPAQKKLIKIPGGRESENLFFKSPGRLIIH